MDNQKATVIILNGTSVSGKSSIQKALQDSLTTPFMAMGIDSILVKMLPERYFLGDASDKKNVLWGEFDTDAQGNPLFHLFFGEQGRQVMYGMHDAIAAFAKNGNSVLVDYIRYEPQWLPHLTQAMSGVNAYFIGVDIPLDVLEAREKARATSPVGHARSHYDIVHSDAVYDLRVNTAENSAEDIAAQIIAHIQEQPATAFETMRNRKA